MIAGFVLLLGPIAGFAAGSVYGDSLETSSTMEGLATGAEALAVAVLTWVGLSVAAVLGVLAW